MLVKNFFLGGFQIDHFLCELVFGSNFTQELPEIGGQALPMTKKNSTNI